MDFKLTAGLNINESTVQIKKDIREVEDALKRAGTGVEVVAKTKFHVTEVRSSLKAAINNSKNGVHAEIGTKFSPNEIKKSVTAAIDAVSNMPKLPIQIDVDTYVFQQSIQTSINGLPPVLLNVDVNPTSLQKLLKGLTKQLDLKLSPKTPKTSSSVGYDGYSGRQLSTFNKADSVLQKMYELENVTTKAERRIIKEYAKIHQAIESATTAEDYDIINKHIQKMDNMVKGLQSRTLDKKEVVQVKAVRDVYQEMYSSLEDIGEEHSLLGQYLKQELDLLKQASEYSHRRVIDAGELDSIKEAIKGQKDYATAVQQVTQRFEQLQEAQKTKTLGYKKSELLDAKKTLKELYQSAEESYGKANVPHNELGQKINALKQDLYSALGHNDDYVFSDQEISKIEKLLADIAALNVEMPKLLKQNTISSSTHTQISHAVNEYEKLYEIIKKAGKEQTELGKAIASHITILKTAGLYDSNHVFDDDYLKKVDSALKFKDEAKSTVQNLYREQPVDKITKSAFSGKEKTLNDLKESLQKMSGLDAGKYFNDIDDVLTAITNAQDLMSKPVWNRKDEERAWQLKEAIDQVIESVEKYQSRARSGFGSLDKIDNRLGELDGSGVNQVKDTSAILRNRLNTATTKKEFQDIAKEIKLLDDEVEKLENNTFDASYQKKISSVLEEYKKLYEIVKKAGGETSVEANQLKNTIKLLTNVASYSDMHVFAPDTVSLVHSVVDGLNATKEALGEVYQEAKKTAWKPFDIDDKATSKLDKTIESLRKIGIIDDKVIDDAKQLIGELENIHKPGGLLSQEAWNESDMRYLDAIRIKYQEILQIADEYKRRAGAEFFDTTLIQKFEALRHDLSRYASDNSKLKSNDALRSELDFLLSRTYWDEGGTKNAITQFETAIERFKNKVRTAGFETKNFSDKVKELFAGITLSGVISRLGDRLLDVFRDAVDNVKTLDSAMTELKKVTDESSASYSRFMQNAKSQAQEVGATLSDVIYSTADFARLGYSIEEATELSRVSTIYKNVGDGFESVTESSEALISIMKAFGVETENVITIADKLNNIGNKNAISSGGLGRALQTSASALMEAGASMEEAMALVSGANGVIQDPSQVGAGLRTNDCPYVQKCA